MLSGTDVNDTYRLVARKAGNQLIRLSTMRNFSVVCHDKKTGLLQNVRMDKAQKRVIALIVSCGFHGKRVVPCESVLAIAEGYILVSQTIRFTRQKEERDMPFVRDTTGMLVGRVSDYAIDENSFRIMAIEVIPGYMPSEYRRKQWVSTYSCKTDCDEIVIPTRLDREPLCQWEENQ